jgi:Kef-type K+ transport system membrane component KefB
LAGTGAIVLTFLAGAELDPVIFKTKWREALLVRHYILGWSMRSSCLCGVALSTTSVAVVYAVMLELGFNVTDYGKSILAACFVNDLTFGFLTPFYFIRAGSFVSVPTLVAAPATLLILFLEKMASKTAFVFPTVRAHHHNGHAGTYYTLMMSTGLTFGTISALFGLNHQIITQAQYSFLVGTVIASAVLPTLIANTFFLPRHLLPREAAEEMTRISIKTPVATGDEA